MNRDYYLGASDAGGLQLITVKGISFFFIALKWTQTNIHAKWAIVK